jgi:cellulose synthase/poly-beta-1,6-N-acetylglucosamine synthase-like glycosyltransferase
MGTLIPYLIIANISVVIAVYGGYALWLKLAPSHRVAHQLASFRPKVSMIVPVYNESKIIEKRLDNIKSISYPRDKFEVIFVDGNSSDGTRESIQNRINSGESYIRLISEPTPGRH